MAHSNLDKVCRAIELINPEAKILISGTSENTISSIIDTIEWQDTNPISKSDIEAQINNAETSLNDRSIGKSQTEIDNKNSGMTKLRDLGLTDDEIKAITKP